ncbi:hypothetical protein [Paenibacillus senegalimassiliensis]|uniref:hypothetical protein n=1 Tax=Paenibacillus senegalimassiliensis TaxID=1737426 RepID=UPI00073E5E68|nr:hypothetical protein [Paenibacillus senegalimassiliensis]
MTKRDKFFKGYKPQFYFRTDENKQQLRDWNKDMELCTEVTPMVHKDEFVRMSIYWLQQYATDKKQVELWREHVRKSNIELEAAEAREKKLRQARPIAEWDEDYGDVLWWKFPIEEGPYCGNPLCSDWPGYHTHWTSFVVPGYVPRGLH